MQVGPVVNVIRLRIRDADEIERQVTVEWPDGARITIHYPSSVKHPSEIGWDPRTDAYAWCLVVNRVPWVFAFDKP